MRSYRSLIWTLGVLTAVLVFAAVAAAESPATMLEEGIYAEQTKGDLNEAIQIYQRIIDNDAANRRHVSEALYRLGSCRLKLADHQVAADAFRQLAGLYPERTDLIERAEAAMAAFYREHPEATVLIHPVTLPDPASLMPADTMVYAEIGSPGMQVETLLRMLQGTPLANPLVLAQAGHRPGGGGQSPQDIMAAMLNPSMIKEFRKIRGLAVGVQDVTMSGQVPMVCVMYPGESDALRGLIVAGVMMTGQPSEPIEGMQIVRMGDEAAAAMDDSVIIVAAPMDRLTWCIRQYKGISSEPTLATANETFARLDRSRRLQDALTVWADGARVAERLPERVRSDTGFIAADMMLDFRNLQSVGARVVINPTGSFVEFSVDMAKGHTNLAYGLIRTPNLTAAGFEAVPADVAGVVSFALNDNDNAAQVAAVQKALSLTGLDIGREVFANIEQVTLFAVPGVAVDTDGPVGREMGPVPLTVGLAITSRNPAQTRHLLGTLLGKLDAAATSPMNSPADRPAGVLPEREPLPAGVKGYAVYRQERGKGRGRTANVYVAGVGRSTILSLNPQVIAASVAAATTGSNAVTAGPLAAELSGLPADASKLILIHNAGALDLALAFLTHQGAMDAQAIQTGRRVAEAMGPMTANVVTHESSNRLVVRAGINDMTPLGDLFPLVMEFQRALSKAQSAQMGSAQGAVADLLGEWVGGIVDSEGTYTDEQPLHLEIRLARMSGRTPILDLHLYGPFLRSPYRIRVGDGAREWMFRRTHHTGVPVRIYLRYVDGELRGSARIGANAPERQEVRLRRPGADNATTQPAPAKAPDAAEPSSNAPQGRSNVSVSASAGGGATATVEVND